MTKAEKYLKDGVDVEEFIKDLHLFWWFHKYDFCEGIRKFLKEQVTPTLTDDERIILKNIDTKFVKIGRDDENNIYFIFKEVTGKEIKYYANVFDNVFQFIKKRRRIRN